MEQHSFDGMMNIWGDCWFHRHAVRKGQQYYRIQHWATCRFDVVCGSFDPQGQRHISIYTVYTVAAIVSFAVVLLTSGTTAAVQQYSLLTTEGSLVPYIH